MKLRGNYPVFCILLAAALALLAGSCAHLISPHYQVAYHGNDQTSGHVPASPRTYSEGEEIIILGNLGDLEKTGYEFSGWNTRPDGSGRQLNPGFLYVVEAETTLYAQWQPRVYQVSYDGTAAERGADPEDVQVEYGSQVVIPGAGTLEREGYAFDGWDTLPDGTGVRYFPDDQLTVPDEDMTLYAQWSVRSFQVSYHGNQATDGTPPEQQQIPAGSEAELQGPETLERTGHQFTGWNTRSDGTGESFDPGDALTVEEDLDLFAQWELLQFQVAWDRTEADRGDPPESEEKDFKETFAMPGVLQLERDGYEFTGWDTRPDGTGERYQEGDVFVVPDHDVMLYAQWEIRTYSLSYDGTDADTGNPPEVQQISHGSEAVIDGPRTLDKTGHRFTGWNSKPDGSGESYRPGDSLVVKGDLAVYAQWEPLTFTVSFDGTEADRGDPPEAETLEFGTRFTLPGAGTLEQEGYSFRGWNTRTDGSGIGFESGEPLTVTEDVSLFAQWEIKKFTVSFDGTEADRGAPPEAETLEFGTRFTLPGAGTLEREGHSFLEWNTRTDGRGRGYEPGDALTVEDDARLYAQWEIHVFEVVLKDTEADRGAPPPAERLEYGQRFSVPDQGTLERRGYSFLEWNTEADGSGMSYQPGESLQVTESVELFAQWSINAYELSYDQRKADSGTVPPEAAGDYGSDVAVEPPGDLERTGHRFIGWNTRSDYEGSLYEPGDLLTLPDTDVTLYAQWEPSSFTVQFSLDDETEGEVPETLTRPYGTSVSLPGDEHFSREGFRFTGWNTEADGTGEHYGPDDEFIIPDADTHLYDQWEVIRITLQFDGGGHTGGTVPEDREYTYGEQFTLPWHGSLVKDSHGFAGWNTASDGSGEGLRPGDIRTAGEDDLSFFAQWVPFEVGGPGQAGGYIFYHDEHQEFPWEYLEASPVDMEETYPWGSYGDMLGVTSDEFGLGAGNTEEITEALGAGDYAAYGVTQWEFNGYDDWFLPSRKELDRLGSVLFDYGVGDLREGSRYWSSSENSATNAWRIRLDGQQHYSNFKFSRSPVRPIRSF